MVKTQLEPICLNRGAHPNSRTEIVHWDGRLDNRDNLRLRLRESLTGNSGDDALALAAYERWGIEGLVHLIGDWSAVIRDRTDGTVILASDFAGVRPLYYHVRSGQVLWSSRLQTLVERTGISELDEEWVAGFLNLSGSPNRTPHQGIYSVPPGHAVRISPRGVTITRFWTLPVGDVIRYRDESRYEEQLRALFREAVAVRLETDSAVLAELSGGLDSSSVVSMANHLIRSGAAAAPRIATVSYVWRNSLDESFIREIEGFCGIEGVHISTHENPPIDAAQVGEDMPAGMAPMRTSVAAVADRLGAKVVLTGQTGDLMMGNFFDDSLQVAAHLREFRLRRACRDALAWSKILSLPIYSILWSAGRAALPAALGPGGDLQQTGRLVHAESERGLPGGGSAEANRPRGRRLFQSVDASAAGTPEVSAGCIGAAGIAQAAGSGAVPTSRLHASVRAPAAGGVRDVGTGGDPVRAGRAEKVDAPGAGGFVAGKATEAALQGALQRAVACGAPADCQRSPAGAAVPGGGARLCGSRQPGFAPGAADGGIGVQ